MTDSKPYFTSDGTISASNAKPAISNTIQLTGEDIINSAETVAQLVVKAARPNSKLILQNMEEVLNSVKEKHRQKHRRKREQRKLAQMEAAAVAEATGKARKHSADSQSDTERRRQPEEEHKEHKVKSEKKRRKHTNEPAAQENGVQQHTTHQSRRKMRESKSPLKSSTVNGDILRHFSRTPKKSESASAEGSSKQHEDEVEIEDLTETVDATSCTPATSSKKVNAFEVMMNARNKSIGSNAHGLDASPTTGAITTSTVNAKRKLMLQEWADKKGAAKHKLEEESRAAYVDNQLENRAKRFKQMLANSNTPKAEGTKKPKTADDVSSNKKLKKSDNPLKVTAEKPKRSRRSKRLDSTESTKHEEEALPLPTPDADTAEFLSKLSSPMKKRDNLLGYFAKKESPTDTATKSVETVDSKIKELPSSETKVGTPKIRSRRSGRNSTKTTTDVTNLERTIVEETTEKSKAKDIAQNTSNEALNTPSGRPKRSCAGKARYDYDLEVSPTKLEFSAVQTKNIATMSELEVDIINLDDSTSTTSSPHKQPKKLAPVFVRSMPKPSPNPDVIKARQTFLMSGVPEKVRLDIEKQKQYEQNYQETVEEFPRVAHVQQFSAEEHKFLQKETNLKMKFRQSDDQAVEAVQLPSKRAKGRLRSSHDNTPKQRNAGKMAEKHKVCITMQPLQVPLPTVENKRTIIKSWKTEFERFPTYKCYNQMREKYRYFSAIDSGQDMEQVSESFVVTRRTQRVHETQSVESEDVKPPATAPNGELLFTEKYKPMLYEQVLVNLIPVSELRDFLAGWANDIGGSGRNSQTMDDSMDVTNDSNSSFSTVCNTVVLLGPASSGKTNAVYALANDLNFNVLEINAGMKRTGKRMLQELQEATQSHQIRKDALSTQTKTKKSLLRLSHQRKQNSQSNDGDSNNSIELSQNARKCLILIEDADVVFEQMDAGFTDAIYSLAACSKRPVIIMATNPNCAHLQRLMNLNTIKFTSPNSLNISRFMAVLSLIENCPINLDDLVSLYLYNGRDLRRTLLEVQFFIQSGGDRKTKTEPTIEPLLRTPEKVKRENGFFASPTKRSLSVETITLASQESDDQLLRSKSSNSNTTTDLLYIHRTLFEFYTLNQNEAWRVPFPVDFSLLRLNLTDLLQGAQRLKQSTNIHVCKSERGVSGSGSGSFAKRKSRSPKKAWLNSATVNGEQNSADRTPQQPLDVLCNLYENFSTAALLAAYTSVGGNSEPTTYGMDRLRPHLEEHIAHELVERTIVVELATPTCSYNLFDTPTERHSLCDHLNVPRRNQRTRVLDYEPYLRSICRSEKQRASQERRSTRFYHYLRNSSANVTNFSTEAFDRACAVMQEIEESETADELIDVKLEPIDALSSALNT